MFARLLNRRRTAPHSAVVADALPAEVATTIAALVVMDRGLRDIETGERRIVAVTADGRAAFEYDRTKADAWLRARWPGLSDAHMAAARGQLHDRVVASRLSQTPIQRSAWASWKPLER